MRSCKVLVSFDLSIYMFWHLALVYFLIMCGANWILKYGMVWSISLSIWVFLKILQCLWSKYFNTFSITPWCENMKLTLNNLLKQNVLKKSCKYIIA